MTQQRTWQGGCHCGRVRYEVTTDFQSAIDCNCSFCGKRGALWSYVGADQFRLLAGESELADYQFNTKTIHHLFCRSCGVASFSRGQGEDGSVGFGINVRCLDGIDLKSLTLTPYDGRAR